MGGTHRYDEDALIEVIVSRSSEQLKAIKAAYKRTYDVDLEDEVLREARGSFKKLLIGLLQANRTPWECVASQHSAFPLRVLPDGMHA